eukprot:5780012-Alexandrium_andersonii.AAC.1
MAKPGGGPIVITLKKRLGPTKRLDADEEEPPAPPQRAGRLGCRAGPRERQPQQVQVQEAVAVAP